MAQQDGNGFGVAEGWVVGADHTVEFDEAVAQRFDLDLDELEGVLKAVPGVKWAYREQEEVFHVSGGERRAVTDAVAEWLRQRGD